MNKFIFKSPRRLVKNSSNTPELDLIKKLEYIQLELRHARQDNKDINRKLDRLLVDKHLQMQVDNYFENDTENEGIPSESKLE